MKLDPAPAPNQHVMLDPDPGLKVRIHPFINLCDLNDGFDKVLEKPDQKRWCRVLVMKCNFFILLP